jgi:hypothetical protein
VQTLEIVQKQRTGIERSDVKDILCRIRCNDIGYTLVLNKTGDSVWYQDSLIINIQDQMPAIWKSKQQVNYSTIFQEKKQTEDNL